MPRQPANSEDDERPSDPGEGQEDPTESRFVILLRHGIAAEATADQADDDRGLTEEGISRMKEVARGLTFILPRVRLIYSSPLVRAVQTALFVRRAYGKKIALATTDALRPGSDPLEVIELVTSSSDRRIILVGHETHLTRTMLAWTGMDAGEGLALKKGGCYGLRLTGTEVAQEWMAPPRLLRHLRK
ncbi:MAG: phosphoglycerate mutase family protein [Acidobacteriota bacterium]